jgi:hypothetical protein
VWVEGKGEQRKMKRGRRNGGGGSVWQEEGEEKEERESEASGEKKRKEEKKRKMSGERERDIRIEEWLVHNSCATIVHHSRDMGWVPCGTHVV